VYRRPNVLAPGNKHVAQLPGLIRVFVLQITPFANIIMEVKQLKPTVFKNVDIQQGIEPGTSRSMIGRVDFPF
jgi:hypothetical protein